MIVKTVSVHVKQTFRFVSKSKLSLTKKSQSKVENKTGLITLLYYRSNLTRSYFV